MSVMKDNKRYYYDNFLSYIHDNILFTKCQEKYYYKMVTILLIHRKIIKIFFKKVLTNKFAHVIIYIDKRYY